MLVSLTFPTLKSPVIYNPVAYAASVKFVKFRMGPWTLRPLLLLSWKVPCYVIFHSFICHPQFYDLRTRKQPSGWKPTKFYW